MQSTTRIRVALVISLVLAVSLPACNPEDLGGLGGIIAVVALNGAPYVGLLTVLTRNDSPVGTPSMIAESVTGPDGEANYHALPSGNYRVQLVGVPAGTDCDFVQREADIGLFITRLEFHCTRLVRGSIGGSVTLPDGSGVSARVTLLRASSTGTFTLHTLTHTDASGAYLVVALSEGPYGVELDNLPDGVSCSPVSHTVTISPAILDPVADFSCIEPADDRTLAFQGNMKVSGGDPSHDPFVFDRTTTGKTTEFLADVQDDRIELFAPALVPSRLPQLSGVRNADGSFAITAFGPIAGVSHVEVSAVGTLIGDTLNLTITVGGNGLLPRGTSITYSFAGTDPLGGGAR